MKSAWIYLLSLGWFVGAAVGAEMPVVLSRPVSGDVYSSPKLLVEGTAAGCSRMVVLVQGIEPTDAWRVVQILPVDRTGRFSGQVSFRFHEMMQRAIRLRVMGCEKSGDVRRWTMGTVATHFADEARLSEIAAVTFSASREPSVDAALAGDRVIAPFEGSKVGPLDVVLARGGGEFPPVVLVMADVPGPAAWYVQPSMQPLRDDRWGVTAKFGNQETPAGSKFRIRVAAPQNRRQSEWFQPGKLFQELPGEVPLSRTVHVTLDPDKLPTFQLDELRLQAQQAKANTLLRWTAPVSGTVVDRTVWVQGLYRGAGVPILLVRCETDPKVWWIQQPCEGNGAGGFQGRVVLGGERTAPGTRFQVVALLETTEQARDWKPGTSVESLPNRPLSSPLELIVSGIATQ